MTQRQTHDAPSKSVHVVAVVETMAELVFVLALPLIFLTAMCMKHFWCRVFLYRLNTVLEVADGCRELWLFAKFGHVPCE